MLTQFREWFELAALAVELLAVLIVVGRIAIATLYWVGRRGGSSADRYHRYRVAIARSLQLGLELLVAADIVRTVTLDASIESVLTLGALVVVRTFLGWSLTVETEGHWPWQQPTLARTSAEDSA